MSHHNLFKDCDIGLKRGEVRLVPHSKNWSTIYTLESLRILEHVSAHLPKLELHHMGSTSVKDLIAKPILDILGGIDLISALDPCEQIFKDLGYEYKGEYGIPGRRYLTLYGLDKEIGYVHLHIFEKASENFKNHLKFRDVLNRDPELREAYQTLKLMLVAQGKSREEYTEAKNELIAKILSS